MRTIKDAARIKGIKYVVIPESEEEEIMEFVDLDDARDYVYERPWLKYFYAFDIESEDNAIKIQSKYMDRYTPQDIADRLLANKRGDNFKAIYN